MVLTKWLTVSRQVTKRMNDENTPSELADMRTLELQRAQLENERLRLELHSMKRGVPWYKLPAEMVPIVTALLAIIGFVWGVVQYKDEQSKNRVAQEVQSGRDKIAAERAFMQPWLESQRNTYAKALATAAEVANASDAARRQRATEEFWKIYHGEMIPVETKSVSGAMVNFGRCLDGTESCDREEMNSRCRALGSATAESMAATARMTYEEFAQNRFKYSSGL